LIWNDHDDTAQQLPMTVLMTQTRPIFPGTGFHRRTGHRSGFGQLHGTLVNENGGPTAVPPFEPITDEQKRRHKKAWGARRCGKST